MRTRQLIFNPMKATPKFRFVSLEKPKAEQENALRGNGFHVRVGKDIYANAEVDFETQFLSDRVEDHRRLSGYSKGRRGNVVDPSKSFGRVYRTVVLPFLDAFNEGVEKRMLVLEEVLCCETWEHTTTLCTCSSRLVVLEHCFSGTGRSVNECQRESREYAYSCSENHSFGNRRAGSPSRRPRNETPPTFLAPELHTSDVTDICGCTTTIEDLKDVSYYY
jgi:hypothetical protein